MENRTNYTELLNKKVISITGDKAGSKSLYFSFEDGSEYKFYHEQDCCESVNINDLDSDLQDFVGRTFTLAEEYEFDAGKPSEWSESYTWTFYRFQDDTGNMIVVRWLGESNGYYSESVSFVEISPATNWVKPYLKDFYDKVGEFTNSNTYEESLYLAFEYFYPHQANRLERYENPRHSEYKSPNFQWLLEELFLGK